MKLKAQKRREPMRFNGLYWEAVADAILNATANLDFIEQWQPGDIKRLAALIEYLWKSPELINEETVAKLLLIKERVGELEASNFRLSALIARAQSTHTAQPAPSSHAGERMQ